MREGGGGLRGRSPLARLPPEREWRKREAGMRASPRLYGPTPCVTQPGTPQLMQTRGPGPGPGHRRPAPENQGSRVHMVKGHLTLRPRVLLPGLSHPPECSSSLARGL